MKLIYNVQDKPKFSQLIIFAFQQLLAIMAATIAVPLILGHGMSTAAALFGAGVGTFIYILFTSYKSPVFLGSSFAFIGSMSAAFAGASTLELGYIGLIIGAILAGIVYIILSFVVKKIGTHWIDKFIPAIVIGPTVSIIGLSLAQNAVANLQKSSVTGMNTKYAIICGLVALFATMLCSTYGKKNIRLIPFIIGILCGYLLATIFTLIGIQTEQESMQIINFTPFTELFKNGISLHSFFAVPDFTFLHATKAIHQVDLSYISSIAVAYIPVAFVVFAEHIADHKNISYIIEKDLLSSPGLDKTLLGDGIGSMVGALFGGCPNTTYGESVACVAITKNASVATILCAAAECIIISFISPFIAFVASIPACVMGGVCMALYGFIAVSGLKMIQTSDLGLNKNLFVTSTILISGIGGLQLNFGRVTITSVATALILGIVVNLFLKNDPNKLD